MLLTRLLNACHHFPGFVYAAARLCKASNTIEIDVRPRLGSKPCCSGCHKPASGYDQLQQRRFEFIPVWGFAVVLLYSMRRVNCRLCGVKVEQVPWGTGKHQLTKAYMLYLAHWARKLSWKETAQSLHTSWEKVQQAVAYVVQWGLEHRQLGPIRAIGVDEIAYGKGHEYLRLVYQIEAGCTRLLWVGEKRTKEAFQKFFDLIGQDLAGKIEFVCSDMWKPYLDLIKKNCTGALNILDRFHVVAKLNLALDEIRSGEARQLMRDGYEPVLREVPLVSAQAPREPDRLTTHQAARRAALQPQERTGLPLEGILPAVLAVRLAGLGRQIPGSVVPGGHAFAHRAAQEVRPYRARPPRAAAELLPRSQGVLQRRHRGTEQQSQSHYEKSLRISHLQNDGTRSISWAWQAS